MVRIALSEMAFNMHNTNRVIECYFVQHCCRFQQYLVHLDCMVEQLGIQWHEL